jgi:prophage antirepressor-like protein
MTSENTPNPATNQIAAPTVPTVASFQFNTSSVRVVIVDGSEFFIAKDVARILGFGNPRQAVRSHISKRDRRGVQVVDTIGRKQTLLAVNESGVYALVFGSTRPEAREFRDWVTSEVLPSLRRTGRYVVENQLPALLQEITNHLGQRGAARSRQLNRIVARRDGLFDFRVGRRWVRGVEFSAANGLALGHRLREGLALSALQLGAAKTRQELTIH